MKLLYWGASLETIIEEICKRYDIELIKSEEKLKKVYKLMKPDLLFLHYPVAEKSTALKWMKIHGEERCFCLQQGEKMSLMNVHNFLLKLTISQNQNQIPIIATHPHTGGLISGYLISQVNNFELIVENPELLCSLPENTRLIHCTLNGNSKIITSDFEFYTLKGRYYLRSITI